MMATAPIWQYVILVILFTLSLIMNFISLGVMASMGGKVPAKNDRVTQGNMFFGVLIGIFAGWLSYSLYVWAPNTTMLVFMVAHWTSIISYQISRIANSGKPRFYTYSQHLWGVLFSLTALVILTIFGIKWL